MHKILTIAALAALLLAPGAAEAAVRLKPITYCPVTADYSFRITGAKGEVDGVGSEYEWLAKSFPGYKRDEQALLDDKKGRLFDILLVSKHRKKLVLCFDITSFFGKQG